MAIPNTAKGAELQIVVWFLESGWEVFTPVADLNETDLVVREPTFKRLVSIQVKHKQPGSKNEGQLSNPWNDGNAPFDYLVFYQPSKFRGVILPRRKLKKEGKMLQFFKKDKEGYSSGDVRPLFSDYAFNFVNIPHEKRANAFTGLFATIHSKSVEDCGAR